jgi:GNAT superfamily N-acetyltransferase
MALVDQIKYVPMDDSSFNYCIKAWLKNAEYPMMERHGWWRNEYYKHYHPYVTEILEQYPVELAVFKEEPDAYLGFACGEKGLLQYVYVSSRYRFNGIATALVEHVCGSEPGRYTAIIGKRYLGFLKSLRKKGWRHETEKIKTDNNRKTSAEKDQTDIIQDKDT